MKVLERDLEELERACASERDKVNALGTAAVVAQAVAERAGARERRVFALAGLALTGINVAVAIWGG